MDIVDKVCFDILDDKFLSGKNYIVCDDYFDGISYVKMYPTDSDWDVYAVWVCIFHKFNFDNLSLDNIQRIKLTRWVKGTEKFEIDLTDLEIQRLSETICLLKSTKSFKRRAKPPVYNPRNVDDL